MGVTDNGIGIPADAQEAIFDKFYRVEQSEHRREVGTGLGLAIAKTIVNQHNGELYVESEEGVGSTFTVLLTHDERCRWHTVPD